MSTSVLKSAMHVGDICVKAAAYENVCHINGIAVLSENRLVVSDYNNRALKLLDVRLSKVVFRQPLSSSPLDVTCIRGFRVAVSLGHEKKIEIYTLDGDTLVRPYIVYISGNRFSGICHGVDGDGFIVVSEDAHDVKMVDRNGNIFSKVSTDSFNDPLFKSPRYIKLRCEDTEVSLSTTDEAENTVTYISTVFKFSRFHIDWIHRHAELKCPVGIAFDKTGDIIVCSRDTDTVHLLSRDTGLLMMVLLDRQRGLAPQPQALCVYGNKMWVSSASSNPVDGDFLRMFQLEYSVNTCSDKNCCT